MYIGCNVFVQSRQEVNLHKERTMIVLLYFIKVDYPPSTLQGFNAQEAKAIITTKVSSSHKKLHQYGLYTNQITNLEISIPLLAVCSLNGRL